MSENNPTVQIIGDPDRNPAANVGGGGGIIAGVAAPLLNTNRLRNNNNNNNQNPLFHVRDTLFHTLFFRAALAYARNFPKPVRRFIEFLILMQAILAFFVLVYIHIAFSRTPTTCLDHVKNSWPRDGILRVEIIRNVANDYNIEQSYAREEKLRHENVDDISSVLGLLARDGFVNIEPSTVVEDLTKETEPLNSDYKNAINENTSESIGPNSLENVSSSQVSSTVWNGLESEISIKISQKQLEEDGELIQQVKDFVNLTKNVKIDELSQLPTKKKESETKSTLNDWNNNDDEYIVEYSLEYGLLRLSPSARIRLKIPVQIVTLDPGKDECFGDTFSRFVLDEFLGYDDLLMASIKTLAEKEDNKGYLRNVVTGEHYRFINMGMARTSYFAAFFIMIVFN